MNATLDDTKRAAKNAANAKYRAKQKTVKDITATQNVIAAPVPVVAAQVPVAAEPPKKHGLGERAMLVNLSIGFWEGRKRDKEMADEVTKHEGAAKDAGIWWTKIIPTEATKPIILQRQHARELHFKYTLPWADDGFRVLPAAMFLKYTAEMRAIQALFRAAVADFVTEYPGLVADGKVRLGGLFDADMFPRADEVANKFPWTLRFVPVPTAGDFRVELDAGKVNEIRKGIERDTKAAMDAAMGNLWNRLFAQVGKIAERLADTKGVFRDSLIGNVVELCNLLPAMNVTNDKELEASRQNVIAKLTKQDPEVLRKNPAARTDTAKAANDILEKMKQFMRK